MRLQNRGSEWDKRKEAAELPRHQDFGGPYCRTGS